VHPDHESTPPTYRCHPDHETIASTYPASSRPERSGVEGSAVCGSQQSCQRVVMVHLFQIQDTRLHRLIVTLDAAEEPALSLSKEQPKIKSVPQAR
jgi:hypothetical protein